MTKFGTSVTSAADRFSAVTPADADLAFPARALFVGVGGDITVRALQGDVATNVVFKNVPSGSILPIMVLQVRATGTTATDIVSLY